MSDFSTYTQNAPVNPTVQAVRDSVGSSAFLISAILCTLTILLSAITLFSGANSMVNLAYLAGEFDASLYDMTTAASSLTVVIGAISLIPIFLFCLGMWIAYGSSKNTQRATISTAGFTLMQSYTIILIVLSALMAVLCVILVIALFVAAGELSSYSDYYYGSYYGYSSIADSLTIAAIIVAIIFAVAITLMIIYYAKALSTLSSVKKAASGYLPAKRGSMYVVVFNFISAGFSIVFIFMILISATSFYAGFSLSTLMSVLSYAVNAAFSILISVAILKYRKRITLVIDASNQAAMYQNTGWQQPQAPVNNSWMNNTGNWTPPQDNNVWNQPPQNQAPAQNTGSWNQTQNTESWTQAPENTWDTWQQSPSSSTDWQQPAQPNTDNTESQDGDQ